MEPRTKYILGGLGLLAAAAVYKSRSEDSYNPFPDDAGFSQDLSDRRKALKAATKVQRFRASYGRQNGSRGSGGCGCGG